MAPLPTNLTDRLWFDYVSGTQPSSQEHTFMVRCDFAVSPIEDIQEGVLEVLTGFGTNGYRTGWQVVRARVATAGNNFSLPVPLIAGFGTFIGTGSSAYTARLEAVEETFQGRSSTTGRRVDLSLYRALADAAATFRVPGAASGPGSAIRAAVSQMNGMSASGAAFLAIDGSPATWYDYLNSNYNSYWEGDIRA